MKIICEKESLVDAINIVQKAVATKTTLPILEGILVEAGEKVKLTGYDLEIAIECSIDADIREKGSIVIDSRIFGDIVRRLPESDVLIEVGKNNDVAIECENTSIEIRGVPGEGFPAVASIEKEKGIKISQKTIKEMIRQTIFAVSTDENRPILTGSLFEIKNGTFTVVSVDGYRLALRREFGKDEMQDMGIVIPGKALNEISKIIQPEDKEMYIYRSGNQILFEMNNCIMVSRLLEGEYLNYSGIIPSEYGTKVTVETKKMLPCFERAMLVITSDERRYPVKLDIMDERMVVTSVTEIGKVREEIAIKKEGNDLEISFNPRYFVEALRVIENEAVDICFTNSIGPCTIKPLQGDDFAHLILPIRK